ncbi:hypothetical protein [Photobacterium lipolyticum]|uniref:Uncharacterized protein n=1 Tax=Photobacterium lipolyticum TaxID=266810 RepID=A0A2T3N369_9GAMM|nr:hypothetical protein [Photobacterium lipolyticum]PSW06724.1 hypothetical protein C9I89_04100 [Photobacterium lipolyticum]
MVATVLKHDDSTFKVMQKRLFPRIRFKDTGVDFFEHFFHVCYNEAAIAAIKSDSVHDNGIYVKRRIIRGSADIYEEDIYPHTNSFFGANEFEKVSRVSTEFYNALFDIFNKHYWIVNLWINVYEANKNSRLGREITRAFIINSIDAAASFIIDNADVDLKAKSVHGNCPTRTIFYMDILDQKKIKKCVRKPYYDTLMRHTVSDDRSNVDLIMLLRFAAVNNSSNSDERYDLSMLKDLLDLSETSDDLNDSKSEKELSRSLMLLFRLKRKQLKKAYKPILISKK